MGTRRRHLSRLLAKRQSLEERSQNLEQPVDKGGCGGLRIIVSDEVQKKKNPIPLLWTKTRYNRDTEMPTSRSMEAQTLETLRSEEHPSRTAEDTCFSKRWSQNNELALNWAQNNTRRKPIHPITDHQAPVCLTIRSCARCRVFAEGATAERCIMVMCSLGRSWFRGLWDKKTRERSEEPDLIQATVPCAPWAHGCLEGRGREGAILVQQRCQWNATRAGVTSILRLVDATAAYLSIKHDVSKEAANKMALNEVESTSSTSTSAFPKQW